MLGSPYFANMFFSADDQCEFQEQQIGNRGKQRTSWSGNSSYEAKEARHVAKVNTNTNTNTNEAKEARHVAKVNADILY